MRKKDAREEKEDMYLNFIKPGNLSPQGWLLKQLQLQASGLNGNLDKIWPDVKDSKWLGGDCEGWERLPYFLDGFIPMAYLLRDEYSGVLSSKVKEDLMAFLEKYSSANPEWMNIRASLKAFGLQELPAEMLLATIRNYFKVNDIEPKFGS